MLRRQLVAAGLAMFLPLAAGIARDAEPSPDPKLDARSTAIRAAIDSEIPSLLTLYRDIHTHPELSQMEVRTSAHLADELRKAGYDVTTNVGGHGIVALLKNGPGPVLLLRADMDALPVKEQTGLPFASKVMGKLPDGTDTPVMHACGHDTHVATWLGTARRLAAKKSDSTAAQRSARTPPTTWARWLSRASVGIL